MSTLTTERKQEIVAQFGDERPGHREHPRPGRAAHRSASTISPSTCASTRRTTTRAAACSCSSASAAGCSTTCRSNDLEGTARSSASSACAGERRGIIAPGTPAPDVLAEDARTASDVHARRPAGQDDGPRLLPVRLQPGLHRPAPDLRGGRSTSFAGPGRDALRRLVRPDAGRRRAFRRSSASRSSSSRTSSPRARPRAAFGAYFEPAGFTNRALVIVGPDGVVQLVAPRRLTRATCRARTSSSTRSAAARLATAAPTSARAGSRRSRSHVALDDEPRAPARRAGRSRSRSAPCRA